MGNLRDGSLFASYRTAPNQRTRQLDKHSHDGLLTGWRGLIDAQGGQIVLLACALVILIYSLSTPLPASVNEYQAVNAKTASSHPAHLHVLVPASHQDPNLCKLLLSAGILGYATPVIINWQQDFSNAGLVEGGSHLAKISGLHHYLNSLDSTHDDDLVLMVDGYDVWLQLRPQTLIDRYFKLNHEADQRIRDEMGDAAAGIKQEIIFGCQKRCWPWTPNDPPCYAVPTSTLPVDVYGSRTDTLASEDNPFINYRPRFLNSGTGIGTVRVMRKLFGQALAQAATEANFGSDQYIFSHIFGDQELWREALRQDAVNRAETGGTIFDGGHSSKGFFNPGHMKEVRLKAAARGDGNFEFGIGVDYGAEIVLNTVFAEDDTDWVKVNGESLDRVTRTQSVAGQTLGANGLSDDIANTLPPFWSLAQEDNPEANTTWRDVPLLTDIYTGNAPAVIHHNAHRDGLKSRRESWWPRIWFQSHARRLYDAQILAPTQAVTISNYDATDEKAWWPTETRKGGARDGQVGLANGNEGWIRFDDICRDYHEEVFRDGKGPWKPPAQR